MLDLILSDLHLDPDRQAGTTLESRIALADWQFDQLERILETPHDRLIINGDLFHKSSASDKTIRRLFDILSKEPEVIINRGNHDETSMKVGDICSLQLLGAILPNVKVIFDEPETVGSYHFIPHCFDQETFNKCIEEVPREKLVFIHANFDNGFAIEPDHSLNLSRLQLDALMNKRCTVFLGHEHAFKAIPGMNILGCSIPTSIADTLSGDKYVHLLSDDNIEQILSWSSQDYLEVDFTELDTIGSQNFVRVTGVCETHEYSKISREIAKLRASSKAFIISNAVKVKTIDKDVLSLEELTRINVIDMLLELVPTQFKDEVRSCI